MAHITDAKMLLKCYDMHERINWVVCIGFLLILVVAIFLTEGWIITACFAAFVIIVFLLEWKFRGLKDRDVERLRELVETGNEKSEVNVQLIDARERLKRKKEIDSKKIFKKC